MRYAVIENNTVTNVIEWDGVSSILTPPSSILVASSVADIGDGYSAGEIIQKTVPITQEQKNQVILFQLAQIDQKKVRALTDAVSGNPTRLQALEAQAASLRGQLV